MHRALPSVALRPYLSLAALCMLTAPTFAAGPKLLANPQELITSPACAWGNISCGQTINAQLDASDCTTSSFHYGDLYHFDGVAGQRVTISVHGVDVDPAVGVYDPSGEVVADDDDSGPGVDALLVYDLNETGQWGIGVLDALAFDLGAYQISLQCSNATPPCPDDTICLNDGQHHVDMRWKTKTTSFAPAHVVPFDSTSSGLFYFTDVNNAEVLIKVINGCPLNDKWWVFYAATTNVQFDIDVTDTHRDVTRTYSNPVNHAATTILDTAAFDCD